VFAIDRGGLVGDDGATHHGALDIASLGAIPNLVLLSPKDTIELRDMTRWALAYKKGPIALRYPRGSSDVLSETPAPIVVGKSETLMRGNDLGILAYGPLAGVALDAARALRDEHGVSAEVVSARWAKPLDADAITSLARRTGHLITLEDGVVRGGFGSAVLELLHENGLGATRTTCVGLPDHFVEHGAIPTLRGLCGMDAPGIVRTALALIGRAAAATPEPTIAVR
jgi:1-deoxy-D-xylulose-5-phosphate synthase